VKSFSFPEWGRLFEHGQGLSCVDASLLVLISSCELSLYPANPLEVVLQGLSFAFVFDFYSAARQGLLVLLGGMWMGFCRGKIELLVAFVVF
jgi:hypothetical protein